MVDNKTVPPWQRPKIAIILSILNAQVVAINTMNNKIRKVEGNNETR